VLGFPLSRASLSGNQVPGRLRRIHPPGGVGVSVRSSWACRLGDSLARRNLVVKANLDNSNTSAVQCKQVLNIDNRYLEVDPGDRNGARPA